MKKIIVLFLGFFLMNTVIGQVEIENKKLYKQEIIQLLEVTEAFETQRVVLNRMKEAYSKHEKASLLIEMIEGMEKEMKDVTINGAVEAYSKYFSLEEIKKMITFYQTDFGKKISQHTPAIVQEMSIKGKEWGEEYARKFIEEHKDELTP